MSVNQTKVNEALSQTVTKVGKVNSAISDYAKQLQAERDKAAAEAAKSAQQQQRG